jgi:hypothetical protein
MSLNAATQIRAGRSINPVSGEWQRRDDSVWLVAFEGTVDVTRAVSREDEKDQQEDESLVYRQVLIIMDAESGRVIYRSAHPTGQERNVSSLEDLTSCLP